MLILFGVVLLIVVVVQFFLREVWVRVYGPFGFTIERDEWPAFYWGFMGLEALGGLFLIWTGVG